MSQSTYQEEAHASQDDEGWCIHSSIDPILANDKARKAKSDDPGWKYAWWSNLNDKNTVQCLLCANIYRGGIKRQKEHLIGGFVDVAKCTKTTPAIREEMLNWKNRGQKRKPSVSMTMASASGKGSNVLEEDVSPSPTPSSKIMKTSAETSLGKKVGPLDVLCRENLVTFVANRRAEKGKKQTVIEDHFKKQEKEIVDELFANMIYQCGLSFNLVNQLSVEVLCEAIGRYGRGYVPPSYLNIRKTLLEKSYEDVAELKLTYAPHWRKYGVTIMTDGWTDKRGRSLLNFLVNCPEGTFFLNSIEASGEEKNADFIVKVIEEHMRLVGVENVVQICTDNASNYVLAGKKLMEKYSTLYWTPCAAHCLDLLLEDIGKLPHLKKVIATGRKITSYIYSHTRLHNYFLKCSNKKELVRCGVTRFATSYLTLQSLYEMKGILRALFVSTFWFESPWSNEDQGKLVAKAVLSTKYWDVLEDCLRASQPILQVLRLVDADDKPSMGYVLAALGKAVLAISENFRHKKEDYQPIVDLINRRMKMHFDHPLFGAGAFLNPSVYYTERECVESSFADLYEAKFHECVEKMVQDSKEAMDVMLAMEEYKAKRGKFGSRLAQDSMKFLQPLHWWDTYGVLTPALKKIAIRILGLCCTASNCERSWSTFEIIQSKRRSNLDPERLKKLVFIKYNKALHERFEKRRAQNNSEDFDPIRVEDLNYSSEWMTGKTGAFNEFVYGEERLTWAEVDEAIGTSEIIVRPKRSSTLTIGGIEARGGRGRGRDAIRHNDSIPVRTYSRKMKQIVAEEHDFEDDENKDEDEEGFEFTDESDAMINEDDDD